MFNDNICSKCPAFELRTSTEIRRIENRIKLRIRELEIIGIPKLIILCESFPQNVYFYDLEYPANIGLRAKLKHELYGNISDEIFIQYLRNDKIIIHDCAYCPLHMLGEGQSTKMRHAATTCLKNYNFDIFNEFPENPIITIFPRNRGFLRNQIPEITSRIKANYSFNNLLGLRKNIVDLGINLTDKK